MSYNTKISYNEYLLMGEETTLLVTNTRLSTPEGVLIDGADATGPGNNPIHAQDLEFFAAIREGREPALSAAAVRPAMHVLQTVQDQFDAWAPPGALHESA